jgi:tetratricopeptide (TPR) repeat protein
MQAMPTKKSKAPAKKRVEIHRFEKKGEDDDVDPPGRAMPIEVDPKRIEDALAKIRDEVVRWANKGRFTKVRFKFRGKQLLPDIPFGVFVAAQGLTFYWGGILRALVFNLAGKAVFDIEMVNESEKKIARGKEYLLSGDLDQAMECFREALDMDQDNPMVHLNLGIALKLKGDYAAARQSLEKARDLDRDGVAGAEAGRLLTSMEKSTAHVVAGG